MDLALGLVGVALTIMIFSYILGDNLFFRVGLYVLIGVAAGFSAAVVITKVIIPLLYVPLRTPGTPAFYWALVPLVLCALLALMLSPRLSQAGKIPLAFLSGVLAALALFGVSRGTLAPQLLATIGRFSPALLMQASQINWAGVIEGVLILLGVIATLFFFHHRQQVKQVGGGSLLDGMSSVGQIFMGITFGALFIGLYMTALVALISQLNWVKDFITSLL